jgi:hypothetical protein
MQVALQIIVCGESWMKGMIEPVVAASCPSCPQRRQHLQVDLGSGRMQ